MKKTLRVIPFAAALIFLAANANAVDIAQTVAGGQVSIAVNTTTIPGAPNPVNFTPSPQVHMDGASETTCFALSAAHDLALGKEAGRQFAMAADSSTVFWKVAPADNMTAVTATNSTPFTTAWNRN